MRDLEGAPSSSRIRGGAGPLLSGGGTFPKRVRVLHRREFESIQRRGIRVQHRLLTVVACRTLVPQEGAARFGCAVSRRVGPAVVRNRLKRLMREVFRQCREGLPSVDLVVILRPQAAELAPRGLNAMAGVLVPLLQEACRRALGSPRGPRRKRGRGSRPRTGTI